MRNLSVRISEIAQERLSDILNYIEIEWSGAAKHKFLKKFDQKISQIRRYPSSCNESLEFSGLYKCVVEKHVSLIYRVQNDVIEILTVFDNRENPESIKRIINKSYNSS